LMSFTTGYLPSVLNSVIATESSPRV
jgi:hypothetical protein